MQNLKSKYEQQEMRVSGGLWDRLEQKLNHEPAKKEKPKMIWLRYAAVAILIFGLGGILWITNQKVDIKENRQFATQTENKNSIESSENNEFVKSNPNNTISKIDDQKFVIENIKNSSISESTKRKNQKLNKASEKEITIKNEEPQIISGPEEQIVQTGIEKPKERVKYVSSSDLLFGLEIDKAKSEKPKSVMGINISKPGNNPDILNPKRIKLFGITLYDKDSITTK